MVRSLRAALTGLAEVEVVLVERWLLGFTGLAGLLLESRFVVFSRLLELDTRLFMLLLSVTTIHKYNWYILLNRFHGWEYRTHNNVHYIKWYIAIVIIQDVPKLCNPLLWIFSWPLNHAFYIVVNKTQLFLFSNAVCSPLYIMNRNNRSPSI